MIDPNVLARAIDKRSQRATNLGLGYWGVVTAISGNQVSVTPTNAETNATALIARARGFVSIGDYGVCLPITGNDWLFVGIAPATAPGADAIAPVDLRTPAINSVANTSSYTGSNPINGSSPTLAVGTWGCVLTGSALVWRSVATGQALIRLRFGGTLSAPETSHEVIFDAASGLSLTTPVTASPQIIRDAANPITITTAGTRLVGLDVRGAVVAGTTNSLNHGISGFFYRIS